MKLPYIFFLFLLAGCAGSIISVSSKDTSVDALKHHEVFAYYALPKTVLKIKIPIANKIRITGLIKEGDSTCLAKTVKKLFGWEPLKQPAEKFVLDKKIIMSAITLPDPDKRYILAYTNSKSIAQTLNISLSKDGLIQSGEFAQESKVFDIVKKSTELLGTAVGSMSGLGGTTDDDFKGDCSINNIKDNRGRKLLEYTLSLYKTKTALLSQPINGVATPDVMKYHIAEIEKQLSAIKAQLVGSITKRIHYVTVHLDPRKPFREEVLLKLNPDKGIVVPPEDTVRSVLSGALKTDDTSENKTLKLLVQDVILPGKVRNASTTIGNEEDGEQLSTDAFMYYNLPARYSLTLMYNDKPIPSFSNKEQKEGQDEYQIYFPQLGKVAFLPKDFKASSIAYYEDTGALKSANLTKEPTVTPERIEEYFMALDSVRRTLKSLREKEEETPETDAETITAEVEEQIIRLIIQEVDIPTEG